MKKMKGLHSIIWLIFLNTIEVMAKWPDCPPPQTLYPCDCNSTSGHIVCGKTITSGVILKQIFQESSRQTHETIVYQKIVFQNSIITELGDQVFDRFAFNELSIDHNDYLELIDENAFKASYDITDKVYFENNPSIGSTDERVVNFFRVLSRFKNASLMFAIDCGLTFIPNNAFEPLMGVQSRLQRLSLANNRIKRIGIFAFSDLPNIQFLNIQQNSIQTIDRLSLVISKSSDNIFIDLSGNQLNSSSFNSRALDAINRPFDLKLNDNSITYLNESVFKPLFKASVSLKLWRNPINCSDCRLKWTTNERLCGHPNHTISYAQRIDFQCKLFKDNFMRCHNDTDAGADEQLDNTLPCPLVSHSLKVDSSNYFIISLMILKYILTKI